METENSDNSDRESVHVSAEESPSQNRDEEWITIPIDEKCDQSGKWMFFFPVDEIDEKWTELKGLIRKGVFADSGVNSIRTSTRKGQQVRGYKSGSDYVICFTCGPPDQEERIKNVGRHILRHFEPADSVESVFYKTEEQSKSGNRRSGQKVNHHYRLDCVWIRKWN